MAISLVLLPVTAVTTFLVFNLLTPSPPFSWFDKGHRIVGLIAQAGLTAEARKEIKNILPGSMTLADAAVWPDHDCVDDESSLLRDRNLVDLETGCEEEIAMRLTANLTQEERLQRAGPCYAVCFERFSAKK